jgi:hypothetical protein
MLSVNYQKRKNAELFANLEKEDSLFLSKTQNYIPLYNRFFSLNENNYNSINLNNLHYISNVGNKVKDRDNVYHCKVKNIDNNKVKERKSFVKIAPLLDTFKYLVGKYNINDPTLFQLPDIHSNETTTHSKLLNANNAAYVDGFFLFLTSKLLHHHQFLHGVDYYGSFLSIKKNFTVNVFDDIEYLQTSDFFKKNRNILYTVDDYDHLFDQEEEEEKKRKPIKIDHSSSAKSAISLQSVHNDLFEDVFECGEIMDDTELVDMTDVDLLQKRNNDKEDRDKDKEDKDKEKDTQFTLNSNSSCSSRSSHTSNEEEELDEGEEGEDDKEGEEEDNDDDEDDDDEEEYINAVIPAFPVEVIFMEKCEDTFDNLILDNELRQEEWFSTFMQIIMMLITYQKSFSFTHNDLHTNNIMYNSTDKKFLYYCYKKKYYKVPTFGRIFKIIDFGRSIYKCNGNLFCSDSFQNGGDAATQYNTEPFFNDQKPRLEPNFSFDLCRLACSIFDHIIDDISEVRDLKKLDAVRRIVVEWCLDDKGVNLLYKNNGADRYPDFKLYKMIARCVHNHTPQAQLERPEFEKYLVDHDLKQYPLGDLIDIDSIPVYI